MRLKGMWAGFKLNQEAARCIGRRDYVGAVERFSKILEHEGENAYLLTMIAQCYEWAGKREEAFQAAGRALHLDPRNFHALQLLARMHVTDGQYHKARDYVVRALDNMPEPFSDRYKVVYWLVNALRVLPTFRVAATESPPRTLLELGSGGGSLAYHLKGRLQLTLTDRSAQMLAVSRTVNPECEHALGDMRSLDLGREFDLVLIHDAIMYATDPAALRATLRTAYRHCRPRGAALIVPDFVRETFEPKTSTGGEDGSDGRGLRYLEWIWDPDSTDQTYEAAFAFLLREPKGALHVDSDRHRCGLFPRAAWLHWMQEAGFSASSRIDPWDRDVFLGKRPGA